MEKREHSGRNFDGGFDSLIYDGEGQEDPPQCPSNQNRQPVSMSYISPGRYDRLAALSLALLAAVLLIVDISLGAHYNKLTDTHLTTDDTEHIESELNKLQEAYKAAIDNMKGTKKQLDIEMSRKTPSNWELEHQTKRKKDYEEQIEKVEKDVVTVKAYLPMLSDGCKRCPPGWILMNLMCYYFPFSKRDGLKSWEKAREFCQLQGGDLARIDNTDKQSSTVNILESKGYPSSSNMGFWIGLKDSHEEGTWKWLDGTILVEGYWNDGEPNDINDEDCAAVYARENFFKSWNDVRCGSTMKWICDKTPTSMT